MAKPTSGITRNGSIKVMSIKMDPLWRERRAEEDGILSPFRARLKDIVGIQHSAAGKRWHSKSLRGGFGDIKKRAGRQVGQCTGGEERVAAVFKGGPIIRVARLIGRGNIPFGIQGHGAYTAGQRTAKIARAITGISDHQALGEDPLVKVRAAHSGT